jgi:hypothetical protein
MKLESIRIQSNDPDQKPVQLKLALPKLRKMTLHSINDPEMFLECLPIDSLHRLSLIKLDQNWNIYQQIIFNQKNLKYLEMEKINIYDFCEVQHVFDLDELVLVESRFTQRESFENFTNFMKMQKHISKLHYVALLEDGMNYKELFKHLLSLKSLKTVEFAFKDHLQILPTLEVTNPNVTVLTLRSVMSTNSNYAAIIECFPKIHTLNFLSSPFDAKPADFFILKYSKNLETLIYNNLTKDSVSHISLKQVKKFIAHSSEFKNPELWRKFGQDNPNIEYLLLRFVDNHVFVPQNLKVIAQSFPKLKYLKYFGNRKIHEEVFEFIHKNLPNLECFEFEMEWEYRESAPLILRTCMPNFDAYFTGINGFVDVSLKRKGSMSALSYEWIDNNKFRNMLS